MATPRKPEDSLYAKVLIHAPAGAGKTRFLGTAQEDPRTFPMALLNWDGGESTLAGLDIDVFDIRDSRDFEDVYRDLRKPDAPWKSYGVDSITETQINTLEEILGKDTVNRADPDQLAQADWGLVLTRMRRIVRQFYKMLPMHGFMTALSKDEVISRIGTAKMPAMQGQFANELPGIPDVVAYLAQVEGEEERILLLHTNPKFGVKTRTPWGKTVPAEIEKPTVTKLLDALGYPAPGKKQR
jgi:hypothetical protein